MTGLGQYAGTVLAAYGVTALLLAVLVAVTLWRGARVRRALDARERRGTERDG